MHHENYYGHIICLSIRLTNTQYNFQLKNFNINNSIKLLTKFVNITVRTFRTVLVQC